MPSPTVLAVVGFHFSSEWLSLSRHDRNEKRATIVEPLLRKYAASIRVRFADAEAFSVNPTDFMLAEFPLDKIKDYYYFVEELRDSDLIAKELLTFDSVLVGIEEGYQEFEREVVE
jgi:hypothetical protein